MRVWWCIAALSFTGFLVPECGGEKGSESAQGPRSEAPKVRSLALSLTGWRGPETAGLLMAEKRGYFADEHLIVGILSPETVARPIKYVVDGTDDLVISHLPQVALAKEKGSPIVAIGSLIPRPTAAMIWLGRSNIQGIADLKGKTIAIPGLAFQEKLLENVLARAGLTLDDVTVRNAGYDLVYFLVSGRADAIFGGSWNAEGIELKSRGLDPVITRTGDLGIPPYEELVFVARSDRVAKQPGLFRDFMKAVRRGTKAAMEEPELAAKLIATSFEDNPEASREEMETEVKATLPLLSKTGHMSPALANQFVKWMNEEELIEGRPPASELLTNSLVTGAAAP